MAASKWNHLSFWRFFPLFYSRFLAKLRPMPVTGPSVILLYRHFGWGFGSQIHQLSLSTPYGPFYTPKTLRFKWEMSNFDAKIL